MTIVHYQLGGCGDQESGASTSDSSAITCIACRATFLRDVWQAWLTRVEHHDTDANRAAEQIAYDELVDFIEAHDLNYTELDPRGAE